MDRVRELVVPKAARWASFAVGTVALWAVMDNTLPRGFPLGIVVRGLVFGSLNALVALGLVLIYRANRVINFAQAELGAVAAVLAIEFVLRLHLNYFVAIAAGLVIAAATGGIIDVAIMSRFRRAPRLIMAVATIGLAEVLNGLSVIIPVLWTGFSAAKFEAPFHVGFRIYPVAFDGNDVLAMVAVPLVIVGLTLFLRFTDYGVAIRAAAENGDRANLLGIPVRRLSTLVWAIAGLLSGLAIILRVPILGFSSFTSVSGGGFELLLLTLAAAVVAGMESLPVTAVTAIGLGVVQEWGAWTFRNSTYVDALLLVVILIALLLRHERFTRATETGITTWRAMREVRPIPAELRDLPEVRWGVRIIRLTLLGAAMALPAVLTPSQNQLAALILIYSMVAVSLVVLTGWAGHISLGHFALVGFGACTTGVLLTHHQADLFLALPAGALVAAGVAFLIGLPALRIRGPFLAVTTLAFAVTSWTFFLNPRYVGWFVPDQVPRPALWGRFRFDLDWQMYYACLLGLVLVLAGVHTLRRTRTGRALIASRDNEAAAQAVSVDTTRLNLTAFAISGAIAGFAGGLYVLHQTAFKTDAFGPEVSLRLFSMVVIGGLGSLPGAILGAVYIRGAEFFLRGGWAQIASGGGIVVLLIVLPGGLGEVIYRIRDRLLRVVARRRGLVVPSLVADVRVDDRDAVPIDLGAALAARPHREHRSALAVARTPSNGDGPPAPVTVQDRPGNGNGHRNGERRPPRRDRPLVAADRPLVVDGQEASRN